MYLLLISEIIYYLKMGDPEPESIGDIQNYLEHFNPKEVGGVVISKTEVMDAASSVNLGSADATGTGQYFVDQTTGKSLSTFIMNVLK